MSTLDTARVLALVASAEKNGGMLTFEESAAILGCTERDIPRLAAKLSTISAPPFGPDDNLDVVVKGSLLYVEAPDAWGNWNALPVADVSLLVAALRSLATGLDAPNRTQAEALASRLLRTLHTELARDAQDRAQAVTWGLAHGVDQQVYDVLHPALEQRRVVTLHYYNHSRDEMQSREVRPHRVVQHDGRWYLSASEHSSAEHRLWRLDRVMSAEPTEQHFEGEGPTHDLFRREVLYYPPPELVEVTLALDEAYAEALGEALPDLEVRGTTAVLRAPTLRVALRLLLDHRDGWRVVAPPEAVEWLSALA